MVRLLSRRICGQSLKSLSSPQKDAGSPVEEYSPTTSSSYGSPVAQARVVAEEALNTTKTDENQNSNLQGRKKAHADHSEPESQTQIPPQTSNLDSTAPEPSKSEANSGVVERDRTLPVFQRSPHQPGDRSPNEPPIKRARKDVVSEVHPDRGIPKHSLTKDSEAHSDQGIPKHSETFPDSETRPDEDIPQSLPGAPSITASVSSPLLKRLGMSRTSENKDVKKDVRESRAHSSFATSGPVGSKVQNSANRSATAFASRADSTMTTKNVPLSPPSGVVLALIGSKSTKGQSQQCLLMRKPGTVVEGSLNDVREEIRLLVGAKLPVVAIGCRGVDVLKWLFQAGEPALAMRLEVHDLNIMRFVVNGRRCEDGPDNLGDRVPSTSDRFASWLQAADAEARRMWAAMGKLVSEWGDCALASYALNVSAQAAVAATELSGVPFDGDGLGELLARWRRELTDADRSLRRSLSKCGSGCKWVNLHSNAQLAGVITRLLPAEEERLWPRTDSGALKLDSATLSQSSLPFAKLLIKCRALQFSVAHCHPFLQAASAGGGRMRSVYRLCGTVTGRMACSSPNLHGIPRDPNVRRLVRSRKKNAVLVKGDFSQVELRVLAELSGDRQMRKAFAECSDLHRATAAALLDIPLDEVNDEERQLAKILNFGLVYGQGLEGLRKSARTTYGIEISLEEARSARKGFFQSYPGVTQWIEEQRALARRSGVFPRTPFGLCAHHLKPARVNNLIDLDRHKDPESAVARKAEREAINFPVQGGAAEVMLACLGSLRRQFRECDLQDFSGQSHRLIAVVHDEFLFECSSPAVAQEVAAILHMAMQEAWNKIFPRARPLDARGTSVSIGPDWSNLSPWTLHQ